MNEDKESLLENFQEPAAGEAEVAPVTEDDMNAVADALLQASLGEGEALLEQPSLADLPAPDENSNPAIAVDDMLTAAVLDEVLPDLVASPASEPSSVPTFQLRLQITQGAVREELKKATADLRLNLPEATWTSDHPMASQLTEFQAIALLQRLRALGGSAAVEVYRPGTASSEEDLALGDLAGIGEPAVVKALGAPAVQLPGNEKGVLLYSGDALPAFPVTETKGIVTAHVSLARRFFRDDELEEKLRKEMEKMPGRAASNLPKSRLEMVFRDLLLDLQKAALANGANAVLGVRMQTFPESNSLDPSIDQMRLVAIGTAAVVEKWDP